MHLRSNDLGKKIPWLADLLKKESSRKWLGTGLSEVCERVARVARAVIEEYQKGDPSARKIVEEACNGLVEMVESSWSRVGLKGCKPVFAAGGLMKNKAFFRLFTHRLGSKVPEAQVTAFIHRCLLNSELAACNDLFAIDYQSRILDY